MSPWLNTADAAELLRYTGKHPRLSVYKFIKRHGLVPRRDGSRLLLARADIERALLPVRGVLHTAHRPPLTTARKFNSLESETR